MENYSEGTAATKVITTFFALILILSFNINNFVFNCKNYLQTEGCDMGTTCAQSYANIFMYHFEKRYLLYISSRQTVKKGQVKFLNELNTKRASIKFQYEISKENFNILTSIWAPKSIRKQHPVYPHTKDKKNLLNQERFRSPLKRTYGKTLGTRTQQKARKSFNITTKTGKCTPCLSRPRNLCGSQIATTTTFMSQ